MFISEHCYNRKHVIDLLLTCADPGIFVKGGGGGGGGGSGSTDIKKL